MKRHLKNLRITQKLVLIMLLTSAAAVLIASTIFGTTEILEYRRATAANVATLADVIGTNSTAAITFEDENLARRALASLSADRTVLNAQMYTLDGRILATYVNPLTIDNVVAQDDERQAGMLAAVTQSRKAAQRFDGLRYLDAVRPVQFDGEVIGFLHLRASLAGLVSSFRRIAMTAIFTVLLTIVVTYFLSFRLQAVVSRPILQLYTLMKRVTSEQDFTLRAKPSGSDEIGTLMRGFNDMLQQINIRDRKLAEQQQVLEQTNINVADSNERLQLAVTETLEAKEAAESASRAKSDFLARMSHEIRTPMNGVLGMAELLLSSELPDAERKFAETIQQSGETLLAVINDILDFSKIEAGKLELDESDFDVAETVEGIVDLLYNRAHSQGVELVAAINTDIESRVRGDAIRLRQILLNLVGNAIKFTHSGVIVVALTAEQCDGDGLRYRFEVEDNGIGIDADQQKLIFDSFAQADVSTTREYGGTGLGLSICKQLVDLMDGEIGVTSTVGTGSVFWFTLRLKRAESDAPTTRFKKLDSLAQTKILVVDDIETNRILLHKQLAAWDVVPIATDNGETALELLEEANAQGEPFDVALLDFFMPGQDGMRLTQEIRSREHLSQPRIVMLSSARPDYEARALREAGVDLYLSKPVRRAPLFNAIAKVLAQDWASDDRSQTLKAANSVQARQFDLDVLLVEDIKINMQVATLMLTAMGCRVTEALNGEQALEAMERLNIDLVLMDCQMPVMDGYTATRTWREREAASGRPRLPIVALTANALSEDRQRCLDAGMDDFVSKPFSRKTLEDAIAKICPPVALPVTNTSAAAAITQNLSPAPREFVLDPAPLEQIAELDPNGDGALVVSVIDAYIDGAQTLIAQLTAAAANADVAATMAAAHGLKSSSANVGASRLTSLCSAAEACARNENMSISSDELDVLVEEYVGIVAMLKSMQSREAA